VESKATGGETQLEGIEVWQLLDGGVRRRPGSRRPAQSLCYKQGLLPALCTDSKSKVEPIESGYFVL